MSTPAITYLPPSDYAASKVRVLLAERDMRMSNLATELGVGAHWTTKRLGRRRQVDLTLEDAQRIADALGVPLADLLPPATP